jgi:hypothetical protein
MNSQPQWQFVDAPATTKLSCRGACDYSGPASYIQHALTRPQGGDLDQILGPRTKNTRN